MPWNATWPDGSKSVKQNETSGQQNTTYIKTTMNNDHYWDTAAIWDGYHKHINMSSQATDPSIAFGFEGIQYLKSDGTRIQGFYRNGQGIYQYIPAFLSGSVAVNSSGTYSNVVAVPANVYGEIAMYTTALGKYSGVTGHFRSNGTVVEAWSLTQSDDSTSTNVPLKFSSGSDAVDLNIKARRSDAGAATWNYRITYRAI